MVYLADLILLCGPLTSKGCFTFEILLKENETYLKGKVEEKEQTSEAEMPDFRQSGHRQFFLYHDVIKHGLHRE